MWVGFFKPGIEVSRLVVGQVVGLLPEVERVVELRLMLVLAASAVDDVVDKALCLGVQGFVEEGQAMLSWIRVR